MEKRDIEVSIIKVGDESYLHLRIACEYGSLINSGLDPITSNEAIAIRSMINELRQDDALNRAVNLILPSDDELEDI